MKLKEFRKRMKKSVFSTAEAHLVAISDDPKLINLQLHQWKEQGELIALKRGLYLFADAPRNMAEIAKALYSPCYFSLEYALSQQGVIPEAVFVTTLVTTKAGRRFETPVGTFIYQKIKKEAFTGFDSRTLMAEREKALTDYFYLHKAKLIPTDQFWEESRLNGSDVNFTKVKRYAKLFRSPRLVSLLTDFQRYATSHQIDHHR